MRSDLRRRHRSHHKLCPSCGLPQHGPLAGHRVPLGSPYRPHAPAANRRFEALVLACIDPRFQEPLHAYLAQRGLTARCSQVTIAGAAIALVAPDFTQWRDTFWDNLAVSVQLHRITRLIAIDHRGCGAARIAYGVERIAHRGTENETHRAVFAEFRRQAAERQPALAIETGLMALDGSVMMFK